VHRLNGGFELIASEAADRAGFTQDRLRLGQLRLIPEIRILLVDGYEPAGGTASGVAARLAEQHEREQATRLRLVRQQVRGHAPEPDRLDGQTVSLAVRPERIVPSERIRGVYRREHGMKSVACFTRVGFGERNASLGDLGLGAGQPLGHRRGRG
jgi:hypothetical protein